MCTWSVKSSEKDGIGTIVVTSKDEATVLHAAASELEALAGEISAQSIMVTGQSQPERIFLGPWKVTICYRRL